MTLDEMIYHRRSCRSFTGKPVDPEMLEKILSFDMMPLYPEIKVHMDMGIALAHLYVANPETFRFFRAETPPEKPGYTYIGSFV